MKAFLLFPLSMLMLAAFTTTSSADQNFASTSSVTLRDSKLASQGMWRDPKNNMVWMRCSLGQSWTGSTCTGEAKEYTWQAAQDAVAAMNHNGGYGGYTDWSLPHIEDLASLIRCNTGFESTKQIPSKRGGYITISDECTDSGQSPAIDQTIFPNMADGLYWSVSPFVHDIYPDMEEGAWYIYFGKSWSRGGHKGNDGHVRAVRAGHEQR